MTAAVPIAIQGVRKTFSTAGRPETTALESVDLTVGAGEFVSIVGASGCGKTTLLRVLAGLTAPSGGEVRIGDRVVAAPDRSVSLMFQSPTLLPWLRVVDNILLPLKLRGRIGAHERERAGQLLDQVGLADFGDRLPRELSGGMQQRVALCRALIAAPTVLLLDEPFGALDAMTRDQMNLDLHRLWASTSLTTVLITHSISEAVMLSQRVVVMSPRPGRIVDIVDVPLPAERHGELIDSPQFAETAARIRSHFARH
ncbi:ABC transporter ATP-binding protein [Plantactinospora sonchi]|uniref:ABC transporter ATP-binding protein n=1 Tax=Plantactinospora sonchi TaxID=1544735 RepID=A0ABU7S5C8_9ACTN